MRFLAVAGFMLMSVFVSSCASPYSTPELDQLDSSGPLAFNGISDHLKQGNVRVIWIHGMCDHDYRWAVDRRDALFKAVGASPGIVEGVYEADAPYTVHGVAKVGSSRLDTRHIVWSPLSTAFKDRLRYDDAPAPGEDRNERFPYERAKLNKQLKQTLMNRCLIDAVVYAGPNGDRIREWVKGQVCEGLGGSTSAGQCRLRSGPAPRTVLVAESLGSKLLFDALRSIWDDNSSRRQAATEQFASVQSVFLLANQIPLLDAADRPATTIKAAGAGAGTLDFLSVLAEPRQPTVKSAVELPDLQVTAFTDPNDLLSYRLSGKGLHFDRVKVINVIVSNAPTYLGLFEMPDAAHCGYKWNRHVMGAVAFGYHDGLKPLAYSLPTACGLLGGGGESAAY